MKDMKDTLVYKKREQSTQWFRLFSFMKDMIKENEPAETL